MKMYNAADGAVIGMKIDATHRAWTASVVEEERQEASVKGDAYSMGANVTLTSANESALIFVKNNEDQDLIISNISFMVGTSTGGTKDEFLLQLYVGATALSAGTASAGVNSNFGSNKTLSATVTVGQEAATVTGGSVAGQALAYVKKSNDFKEEFWVLPKGAAFAFTATPPASNTSLQIIARFSVHLAQRGK